MQFLSSFVLFTALLCYSHAEDGNLPSYIKKCDFKAPGFPECVRSQIEKSLPLFTKGVPELGVPSIDPVILDDILIDGNGLKLTFTNAAMHGLSKCQLTSFKLDIGKEEEKFSLAVKANFSLTAKYNIDGKILILPIQGNGDALVKAQNVDVKIDSKLIHVKDKKGDSHLKLVTPNYKYDIESTTFDLKNLFNGNKELAETTLTFANQNWRQLMDDLAPSAINPIVKTTVKGINIFFSKVPINKMIDNYN